MVDRIIALFSAVFCGFLLVGATPIFGQISVIDQSRSVSTEGPGTTTMNQTDTATPFAPFNDTLNTSGTYTNPGGQTANLQASASQNSTVDLSGQTLHVSAGGEVSFATPGAGSLIEPSEVGGTSSYSVTFQISSPATYKVVEQTDLQTTDASLYFQITSDGARLFQGSTDLIPFPLQYQFSAAPVTFSGALMPGTYVFTGFATVADDVVGEGISTSFSADLTVNATPEPVALPVLGIIALGLIRRRRGE